MADIVALEGQNDDDCTSAAYWDACLVEATTYFSNYQEKCNNVEKLYADTEARSSETADREFQIFWANLEVLKPSIYSRPPVPVVVPRFRSRKELPRIASEMLERCLISSFEVDDIDATMRLARDDLAMNARGVVWCRYETELEEVQEEPTEEDAGEASDEADDYGQADGLSPTAEPVSDEHEATEAAAAAQPLIKAQRVIKEHVDRQDFLHEPARKWKEVGWVARRSWLSRKKGLKRFGDVFLKAEMKAREGDPDGKKMRKAPVWEIWSKTHNMVIWHSPGMDELLDKQPPFLKLEGFYPCPRPAYGTLTPRTLKPVPDLVQYKDQIEEINELTARISSLAESLRLKGFYPGGASDVGDAIETILKDQDNRALLVPLNNLAAFGDKSLKDSVIWLPVDMVATVIKELIMLRRQMIDDVYQITGISDIMRGTSVASETLGAQQLKSQYGSVRVRDRQNELVRLARDLTRIEAEIIAENFEPETLMVMSQMDDLPTDAQIAQQIAGVTQQVQQAAANPQLMEQAKANPEQAQQMLQQAQQHVDMLNAAVTVEKVMELLRAQRIRPFALDIETDSTIQPDEDAAKHRATEMVTAVGGYIASAMPMVQTVPQSAPMVAGFLKYISSQFRAGREVQGLIDDFSEKITEAAGQPKGPSPDEEKLKLEIRKQDFEEQKFNREMQQEDQQFAAEQRTERANRFAQHNASLIAAGKPPEMDPDNATAQAMTAFSAAIQQLAASQQQTAQSLNNLAMAQAAPKRIVRDAMGRTVGMEVIPGGAAA